MSLVTLGSAPYNPYNTTLAEYAVTGMKLGMENLDRMEESNRFSITETSKAFAAVTDNLFKGQEMQLRGREAERLERAQAIEEYQFGEKMAFDRNRANATDTQWLATFEKSKQEFADTRIRTGLLLSQEGREKALFERSAKEYEDAAPLRELTQREAMRKIRQGPAQLELQRASEDAKSFLEATKVSLEAINDNLQKNEALMSTAEGYRSRGFTGAAAPSNALEAQSTIETQSGARPSGPPIAPVGRDITQNQQREEREAEIRKQTEGSGAAKSNPREYSDPLYFQRLESQIAFDYEAQRRLLQLNTIVSADPRLIRDKRVFQLKAELEALFASNVRNDFLTKDGKNRTDYVPKGPPNPKDAE
jgi:hypothetical protein